MIWFQVLTACDAEWVPASGGQVPDGALPSGETEEGEPLFIGRVSHEGTMTVGKVYCYWHLLYVQLLDFTLNRDLRIYRVILASNQLDALFHLRVYRVILGNNQLDALFHLRVYRVILGNNQLHALFHVFIYLTSLHVSSVTALIIRRWNCINTSSGMISLCK